MLDLATHPVSATLISQLEADLRRYDIVVWLDRDGHYTEFADMLARPDSDFMAPVLGYRGSYLELMLALEDHAGSIDKSPLLIHLPGATVQTVRASPLLEVYSAGFRFRYGLERLIKNAAVGRVPPEDVEALLADTDGLSLARADAWMSQRVRNASGELAAMLAGLDATGLAKALFDEGGPLLRQVAQSGAYGELWHRLGALLGLPESWAYPRPRDALVEPTRREQDGERDLGKDVRLGIRDAMVSWALCIEYVHDLGRDTTAAPLEGLRDSLTTELRAGCEAVAKYVRHNSPHEYERLALDIENFIEAERDAGTPAQLGSIDTFRFEERQLYFGALDALDKDDWQQAGEWARERLEGQSFWVRREPQRKNAWTLVSATAELGAALATSKLSFAGCTSLAEATENYVEHGARVDRLHRELGQRRVELLYDKVPEFERLRAVIERTRRAYLRWGEARACEWTQVCIDEGPLPGASLRQRQIFDDVVAPLLVEGEKTALFMVDAMRFEMATEFLELLGADRKAAKLRPYLAELPSVTEVGMNALAPVVRAGKLRPKFVGKGAAKSKRFKGFTTGEFVVHNPETRKTAMGQRTRGATCPKLALGKLLRLTTRQLVDTIKQAQLIIVHSVQIDAVGEKGAGLSVFSSELLRLRKAWQLLRSVGVSRFIITSDHGFLLRVPGDTTLDDPHDNAKSRYALNSAASNSTKHYSVPLRALDYEDAEGYLVFPRGLEVFAKRGRDRNFVHGGNSPQERIIPALTLHHKTLPGGSDRRYQLKLCNRYGNRSGMHYLEAELVREIGSGFNWDDPNSIDLGIRVLDDDPDDPVQAHVNHGDGGAQMEAGLWRVPIGQRFRLYFRLTGPRDVRVRIELVHPSGTEQIEIAEVKRRFVVTEVQPRRVDPPPSVTTASDPRAEPEPDTSGAEFAIVEPEPPAPEPTPWLDAFDDADARKMFEHLANHGSINEQEATLLLGKPRRFRRFVRNFDDYKQLAPFVVSIETINGVRRYVKQSDK